MTLLGLEAPPAKAVAPALWASRMAEARQRAAVLMQAEQVQPAPRSTDGQSRA
jgi:hypothetical protein